MNKVSAVCFDAFGTLIHYNGRRINPYRRLLHAGQGEQTERLPFLIRNAGVSVFAEELGLSYMLPTIQRELDDELAALQLFPEVEMVLRSKR